MVAHACNPSTLGGRRKWISEFEASLVYRVSSRTVRAIQRNHVSSVFEAFPPTFSSIRSSLSGLMLRSLIHLDLSFVQGDKYRSIFIFLYIDRQTIIIY